MVGTERRWMTGVAKVAVLLIGGLATIATSAPVEPSVEAFGSVELAADETRVAVVTFNEATISHSRTFDSRIVVEFVGSARIGVASYEYVEPATESWERARFRLELDDCPATGACVLRFAVAASLEPSTVTVQAAISVAPDSGFLFPENRDYPSDANVSIRFE